MISVIRVEAVADDPAQAKYEIDTILTHMREIGHLEGIVPQCGETKGEVYDARESEDYIRGEGGGRFWFPFAGRKILHFLPEEHPYNTPQMPREQKDYEVKVKPTGEECSKHKIVVERLLPMDWPQQFKPRPVVDEVEQVLYELKQMGMDYTIVPLPDTATVTASGVTVSTAGDTSSNVLHSDRWRIDVSYGDGKLGYHSVGPTLLAAARDALSAGRAALGYDGESEGNNTSYSFSSGSGIEFKTSG
jgi:hypothetical protein